MDKRSDLSANLRVINQNHNQAARLNASKKDLEHSDRNKNAKDQDAIDLER